jgi:hypothetical protein
VSAEPAPLPADVAFALLERQKRALATGITLVDAIEAGLSPVHRQRVEQARQRFEHAMNESIAALGVAIKGMAAPVLSTTGEN